MILRWRPSRDFLDTAFIVASGLALRLIFMWVVRATWQPLDSGEATHAAIALARTGVIADGFVPGQGPTAHVMPVMVVIAAGVFRVFGVNTPAAMLVLGGWALFQTLTCYLLLRSLFLAMGMGKTAARAGLLLMCLQPALAPQETCDFRVWEGAFAVCLAAINLRWIVLLDSRRPSWTELGGAAVLAGFTAFVSPPAGLAVDCCWAFLALRRLDWRRTVGFAAMGVAALVPFFGGWALRNQVVMGEPVLVRSNFGLEFAIANHPAAATDAPRIDVLNARMLAIHPFDNPHAFAALKAAGGEIAYSHMLGREAWQWARTHPADFARLSWRHYREFYLPETWQFKLTNWANLVEERAIVMQTICALGLAGLAWGLLRRRRHYATVAIYFAVAGLPYALVQPIPRYSFLVYGMLGYLAAGMLTDVAAAIRRLRSGRLDDPVASGAFGVEQGGVGALH